MSNSSQDSTLRLSHRYAFKRRLLRNGTLIAAAACFWAAALMPAPSAAAPITVSGTVTAKITVNFVTAPPAGSTVLCGVALISNDALAPNDSKSVTATVSGSSAVCSFPMDYKWTVSSATSIMTIAYSVAGPAQSSSAIFSTITVPPNGTKTNVTVAVTQ
jgi:hypothetical protein